MANKLLLANGGALLQDLVERANPAHRKCHGRGVTAASWSENQAPMGSGRYWPESFYEEDLCDCVPEQTIAGVTLRKRSPLNFGLLLEGEALGTVWPGILAGSLRNPLTLYEAAHWGCLQCAMEHEFEMRGDDEMYWMHMCERIDEILSMGPDDPLTKDQEEQRRQLHEKLLEANKVLFRRPFGG